jgi:hypothetical protein
MDTAHMAIALGNYHWSQQHHTTAVIQPIIIKEMEYMALMQDPHLRPLWKRGFREEIVQQYNLKSLAVNGWVYIEIRKSMYGLKQTGLLANKLLQMCLAPYGYYLARHTPGLWLNKTRPISFTLVVDDYAGQATRRASSKRFIANL